MRCSLLLPLPRGGQSGRDTRIVQVPGPETLLTPGLKRTFHLHPWRGAVWRRRPGPCGPLKEASAERCGTVTARSGQHPPPADPAPSQPSADPAPSQPSVLPHIPGLAGPSPAPAAAPTPQPLRVPRGTSCLSSSLPVRPATARTSPPLQGLPGHLPAPAGHYPFTQSPAPSLPSWCPSPFSVRSPRAGLCLGHGAGASGWLVHRHA